MDPRKQHSYYSSIVECFCGNNYQWNSEQKKVQGVKSDTFPVGLGLYIIPAYLAIGLGSIPGDSPSSHTTRIMSCSLPSEYIRT